MLNLQNPKDTELFIQTEMSQEPRRLAHVTVIAQKVRESAYAIQSRYPALGIDPELAYCAALLHDIGYSPCAKRTGFHPKDGADFLRQQGYGDLAELIESHSCSPEEASIGGYPEIKPSTRLIAKLITYWDMQVKQGGEIVSYEERLSDILSRYGAESPIGRANLNAKERISAIFREIEGLLSGSV